MKKLNTQFYLVDVTILPDAIKKTIRAKEFLKQGTVETINDAVKKAGLSRSAYYKYKDHVSPAFESSEENLITLFIIMTSDTAVLNRVLKRITKEKCNIVSVTRSIPTKRLTAVTLTFETAELQIPFPELIHSVSSVKGVKKVEVVGEERL